MRRCHHLYILLTLMACSPIEPTTDFAPSFADETTAFGFQIGVPADLAEARWRVKDPSFLAGSAIDGFQQLQIRRVFGIQVDAPPGGEHLLNINNEFGSNPLATRLVVYVYERPEGVTLQAFSDSVRGVAYDATDGFVNNQDAKTLTYKGTRPPERPRNAAESLLPRHILANDRYFYFIIYWDDEDPEIVLNTHRVGDTFTLVEPSG